jgi:hypothetical protein
VDVSEVAFAVENLLRPLPADTEGFRKGAQKLDDLRDVVVVFTVFGPRLRVEKVVARDEFKNLPYTSEISSPFGTRLLRYLESNAPC